MRKWLSLLLFWLILTPLLLELLFRAAVPYLPPSLQLAAERLNKGESLNINRIGLMTMDIDHNFMMRPNIDNALYGPHKSVIFHVSTIQILDSRMGFRTPPVQQGDQIDVAVVGDSFSFCFTEFEDCWVTQFEQNTGLRTMNLSQGSTGSRSHWNFIDTFGRAFKPPLVIWQWFGNDFNEDYQLSLTRGEMEPIQYGETIPDYDANVSPVLTWLRSNSMAWVILETALVGEDAYISDFERYHFTRPHEVQYNGHTLRFGQKYEQIALNMNDPRVAAGLPMTREALLNAKEAVKSWGGEFVVFMIPVREQVYADLTAPLLGEETMAIYDSAHQTMLSLCDELEIRCLDLLPGLQEAARQGEHLYYTEDMHLNPRGNEVVEQLVREWLVELELIEGES